MASTVAACRASPGQGSAARLRDYFISFGGERPPDESGRRAPSADVVIIDASTGAALHRPALADAGWPEPRKFAAAAAVYKPGGFAVFDDVEQTETRKLGKARPAAAAAAAATSSAAPQQPGASTSGLPSRKAVSAGMSTGRADKEPTDSGPVPRLPPGVEEAIAAERALAAAATGACVVVFGGYDASGRLLDDLLLFNVEAALDSQAPPGPPGSAPPQQPGAVQAAPQASTASLAPSSSR